MNEKPEVYFPENINEDEDEVVEIASIRSSAQTTRDEQLRIKSLNGSNNLKKN
jgi:hypothetical protein